MALSKVFCVLGLAQWKILAVAGVVLLVFLPPSPPSDTKIQRNRNCNTRLSSIARRIVHQTLLPVVTSFPTDIKLPYQCPLHPVRDIHGRAELAKLNYRVNLWTCSQCGKSFTDEHDLETHIHQRHPGLSDCGDFSVCLADYCDVLRCDPQGELVTRRPWPVRTSAHQDRSSSHTVAVARAPSRELVAMLANTDSGLVTQGCPLTGDCLDNLNIGPKRLRRAAIADQSMSSNRSSCKDCYRRKHCNQARMDELKQKCEMLVDTCISPLALKLTDKEHQELRAKLETELCSYLTCDKYWNVERSRHSVNIGVILLITLTITILYLMFVYHLVWVWY